MKQKMNKLITEYRFQSAMIFEDLINQKQKFLQLQTLASHFLPLSFMFAFEAIQFDQILQLAHYSYLEKTHLFFIGQLSHPTLIYEIIILVSSFLSLLCIILTVFLINQCSRKSMLVNNPYKKTQISLDPFKFLVYLLIYFEILMLPLISSTAYIINAQISYRNIPYYISLVFIIFSYTAITIINRQRRLFGLFPCLAFISFLIFPKSIVSSVLVAFIAQWEYYSLWGKTGTKDLRQKTAIKIASVILYFMAIWNIIIKTPIIFQFFASQQKSFKHLTLFIIGLVFVGLISYINQIRHANRTLQMTNRPKGDRIKQEFCHNRILYYANVIENGRQLVDFTNSQVVQLQSIFMRTITDKRISLIEYQKFVNYKPDQQTRKAILNKKSKKLTKMLNNSKHIISDYTPEQFFEMSINVIQSQINHKKNLNAFVAMIKLKSSPIVQQINFFQILKQIEQFDCTYCVRLTINEKFELFKLKRHCIETFNSQPNNTLNNQICNTVYELQENTRIFRQSAVNLLQEIRILFASLNQNKQISAIIDLASKIFDSMTNVSLQFEKIASVYYSPQETVIMASLIKILNGFKDQIQIQLSGSKFRHGFRFGLKSSKSIKKKSAIQDQIQYQTAYCIVTQAGQILQISDILQKQLEYYQISSENNRIIKLCPYLDFKQQIQKLQNSCKLLSGSKTQFLQQKQKLTVILDSKTRHIVKKYSIVQIPNIITGTIHYIIVFIHPKQLSGAQNLFPYSIVYRREEKSIISFCQRFDRTFDITTSELIDDSRHAKPYIFDVIQCSITKYVEKNLNTLSFQTMTGEMRQTINMSHIETFKKEAQFEQELAQKGQVNTYLNIPQIKSRTTLDFNKCRKYKVHCTLKHLNQKSNLILIYPGHSGVYPLSSRNGFISQKSLSNVGSLRNLPGDIAQQQVFFCKIQNTYKFKIAEKVIQLSEQSCNCHSCVILVSLGFLLLIVICFFGLNFYLTNQNITQKEKNIQNTSFKDNFYYDFLLSYKDSLYLILNSQVKHQECPFENNLTNNSIKRMQQKLPENLKAFLKLNINQNQSFKINYTLNFKNFNVKTDTTQTTLVDYIVHMKTILQSINQLKSPLLDLSDYEVEKSVMFLLENYHNIWTFKQHYQNITYYSKFAMPFYLLIVIFIFLIAISLLALLVFLYKKYWTLVSIFQIIQAISEQDYQAIEWRFQQIIQNVKNIDVIVNRKQNEYKNKKQIISSKQDAFTNQVKIICEAEHSFIGTFNQLDNQQHNQIKTDFDIRKISSPSKPDQNQLKYSIFTVFKTNLLLIGAIAIITLIIVSISIGMFYGANQQVDYIFKYVNALHSFRSRQLEVLATLYYSSILQSSTQAKKYRKFLNTSQYFNKIEKISITDIKIYGQINQNYKETEKQYIRSNFCQKINSLLQQNELSDKSDVYTMIYNFIRSVPCKDLLDLNQLNIHPNFKVVLQNYESLILDLFKSQATNLFTVDMHLTQAKLVPIVWLQYTYEAMNIISEKLIKHFNKQSQLFLLKLLQRNEILFFIIFCTSLILILLATQALYKISMRDNQVGTLLFNIIPKCVVYDVKICKMIKDKKILQNLEYM